MSHLVALPTEVLDEIFSYLDWDRETDLFPKKPDVDNASLTCKTLRNALVPVVFRDVVLRLRWVNGSLIVPYLFRLRQEHAELATHIRCVHIRTEFEPCPHCAQKGDTQVFTLPQDIDDWMNPSKTAQEARMGIDEFRVKANVHARKLAEAQSCASCEAMSAEEIVKRESHFPRSKHERDALSIVMLCIPAWTQTLIFQSLADSDTLSYRSRNEFATRLLATAIELLGGRLQDLVIVSTSAAGAFSRPRRRFGISNTPDNSETPSFITPEILSNMAARKLTFALTDSPHANAVRTSSSLSNIDYSRWHRAAHCTGELDICYTRAQADDLLNFVKGFTNLEKLTIREVILHVPRIPGTPMLNHVMGWLNTAISIRQMMPNLNIQLGKVYIPSSLLDSGLVPTSAVTWICNEAVPKGAVIDHERTLRLIDDFTSFLPLWEAEDGARGMDALRDWEKKRALLCDEAMSRRWR